MLLQSTCSFSVDFDGEDNRVHPVILYPPQPAGSTLVFKLKVTSSMLIRKSKHPAVRAKLWGNALGRYLFGIIMHRSFDIYYSAIYWPAENAWLNTEFLLAMLSALKDGVLAADLFW